MTAKEYLDQVKRADRLLASLRLRAENLRMLLTDTAVHITGMARGHSTDEQRYETLHAEIDEAERKISEAEAAAEEIRAEVGMMLCRIWDPIMQKVLIMHYLDGKRWAEVAGEIGYSLQQTNRYKNAGLKELEAILAMEFRNAEVYG